ncbi:MAG TPA: 50S ribosomal protein L6 [Candidatus Altiarchaeales archaeon]|nr:50S ribosomal protein L6 [Candidatus Altiarchaeales archaeon]
MAGMELEIRIPENVDVEIKENAVTVKGRLGELTREFPPHPVKISKKDNSILLSIDSDKRRQKAVLGTYRGHIQNMIRGVSDGITYKLRVVYSHFPMSIKVQGDTLLIENFLGEKRPRKARILENVSVDVKGRDITVSGIDKENVAQTAANLEQATRITGLDPRVFQDGIYIVEKDGKEIK